MENQDNFKVNILLRDGINRNLNRLGWNLRTLSETSKTPYETLKKISNAKTKNPTLINTLKISNAFKITPDNLLGIENVNNYYQINMGSHSKNFLTAIIELENLCTDLNSNNPSSMFVPLLKLVGNMHDAMIYNSFMLEPFDIKKYNVNVKDNLICALKITSDTLIPFFRSGDVSLICSGKMIPNKVYIIMYNNHIYFRKFCISPEKCFAPLTPTSNQTYFTFENRIHILGYIDTVIS